MAPNYAGYSIEARGQQLYLHATGAVFWPKLSTLFVADLHIGRDISSASADRSRPECSPCAETLHQLRVAIETYKPDHVVILGDFLHGRKSLPMETVNRLNAFWEEHSATAFSLVLGNHDRLHRTSIAQMPLQVLSPPHWCDPFWLVHDPDSETPSAKQLQRLATLVRDEQPEDNIASTTNDDSLVFVLGGHLHPAVQRNPSSNSSTNHQHKCFVQSNDALILPAMSVHGRNKTLQPSHDTRIYLIVDGKVSPLTEE